MQVLLNQGKGQLVSECLFGVLNFPKKQTKTIRLEVLGPNDPVTAICSQQFLPLSVVQLIGKHW